MKNIKTFQETKKRLKKNAGAGLNKVVCVVVVLILIVLVCVGGFFWYKCSKNKVLNPLEQSGEKIESGEIEGANGVIDESLSVEELVKMGLQVGDCVSYATDINASKYWRVWKIEEDNIVIVPAKPLGNLELERAEDWLNAEEKIENECDKYVNSNLGITAENIRSMKIEDIEEVIPEEEVENAKLDYDYGKEYSYKSGIFYAEKADADTFDEYNKELSTSKIANSNSSVKLKNTYWYKDNPTWNSLESKKNGMTSDTYGDILGNTYGWLASRCVRCISSDACFGVRYVNSGSVTSYYLCGSDGGTRSFSVGVRPLVFLDSKLFNGEGKGTWNNPWQLGEKIESGEIERTNGGTSGNLSGDELMVMGLQVGDYVSYMSDIGPDISWRVWKIEGDNIIIVPIEPLGKLILEGAEDWLNAEEKIENECDKYVNSSLGITAEEIRSIKIEDIEEVMPEEEVTQAKQEYDYGKEFKYISGTFYAEKANESSGTFDGYNKALSSSKSAVTLVDTYWGKISPTWNELNNKKSGMTTDTYGTILGTTNCWLASRCVTCDSSNADFGVRDVDSGNVYYYSLYYSDGDTYSRSRGVRPLVSLSFKLFNGAGEGTSDNPWKLNG